MSDQEGVVMIRNKPYHTVAKRLRTFWDKHPEWRIKTKVEDAAEIVRVKATIYDERGTAKANGYAEECRGQGDVNKTSAMENCETSAIGRALGVLGMGGTHIASAEEMEIALEQQKELKHVDKLLQHNAAVRDNIESIVAIKAHLFADEYSSAYEAIGELDDETLEALRLAPTFGGIFTTDEIAKMKSNEWTAARRDFHGLDQ